MMIKREECRAVEARLLEPRREILLLNGPRQAGKTTAAKQVLESLAAAGRKALYFSAAAAPAADAAWLSSRWKEARREAARAGHAPGGEAVLVLDEVHLIPGWRVAVEREWGEDSRLGLRIKPLLIVSTRAARQALAGGGEAFREIRMTHWTYAEMQAAFGATLDEFVWFGGCPGERRLLLGDEMRWKAGVKAEMVEAALSRDLLDGPIGNPVLFRRTLERGLAASGEVLSLTRLLAELHGRGNAATIAGYLERLGECGLLRALPKFSGGAPRQRASIPKLQALNPALCAAFSSERFSEARSDPVRWARCVKSAVGAHLASEAFRKGFELFYWREGAAEVDFVLQGRGRTAAIAVESGGGRSARGLEAFSRKFHTQRALIVGRGGLPLEAFFFAPLEDLLG